MLKRLALLFLLFLAGPALAQPAPVRVLFETSAGNITIEVDPARAPITGANFLLYIDQRRYDGATFYRAMQAGQGRGLIQGGVDERRELPPIAHEPTSRTGLSHVDGAVSIARDAPGTATADIYITLGDMTYLDAGRVDPNGYAVFGRVVEGMDVVRRIQAAETAPNAGRGAMRGQMLSNPVRIVSARRAE